MRTRTTMKKKLFISIILGLIVTNGLTYSSQKKKLTSDALAKGIFAFLEHNYTQRKVPNPTIEASKELAHVFNNHLENSEKFGCLWNPETIKELNSFIAIVNQHTPSLVDDMHTALEITQKKATKKAEQEKSEKKE